jgi:hypothetical protein
MGDGGQEMKYWHWLLVDLFFLGWNISYALSDGPFAHAHWFMAGIMAFAAFSRLVDVIADVERRT